MLNTGPSSCQYASAWLLAWLCSALLPQFTLAVGVSAQTLDATRDMTVELELFQTQWLRRWSSYSQAILRLVRCSLKQGQLLALQ